MKKLLGLILALAFASTLRAAVPGQTRTILVLPFENESPNADLGWISEAFAQVLSVDLAGTGRYVLDREERNAAYEQLGIPAGTPITLASAYKVTETLGVDWTVVGKFSVAGSQLTASCQLLQAHPLKLSPPIDASGALSDLLDVQARLAWRLLALYDPQFTAGDEEAFARIFPPVRLDAFENYTRGILATDDETRLHFLKEADRIDPADHRAAFELGRYYFQKKAYPESATWLRKLVPSDSGYLESLFLLGVDDYFIGDDARAQASFAALQKQIPLSEATNDLGVVLARRGDYQSALTDFASASRDDPLDPDFNFNLAVCLWQLKRYGEAARYLNADLAQQDNDPEAHALLAIVLHKLRDSQGERRQAAWLSAHGSSEDPSQDFAPELRLKKHYDGRAFGLLTVMLHNAVEARLSQENPAEHGQAHLSQGKQFLAEGRFAEAERELQEASTLLPENSEVYLVLGQVFEAEGRHQQAADQFKTALLFDDNAVTHLWLAQAYLSMNQTSLALAQDRVALSMSPNDDAAKRLLNDIQRRNAQP
ncbi:MAG TPA: tetratricopeptide repeat protein [Terriglobia bacterium]|nr:tetratricopeptide repeat protein [Terriglobia bacterium]